MTQRAGQGHRKQAIERFFLAAWCTLHRVSLWILPVGDARFAAAIKPLVAPFVLIAVHRQEAMRVIWRAAVAMVIGNAGDG